MYKGQRDVQEQIKEEFLPRPDKYKDILNNKLMPDTNESVVVIPCLTKTYGFKTNQYKPNFKYLKGVIPELQFNSFIRKANNIIEKQLMSKSKQQNEPFFKITSILLKISIILSALALILMAVITYKDLQCQISNIFLYVSIVFLSVSGLVSAFCPVFLYQSKYTSLNYQHIISQQLKTLQSNQNKENEAKGNKQYKWKIQNNFYWVELHIDRLVIPKSRSLQVERFTD